MYSPVNEWKLSREARKEYDIVLQIMKTSASKIYVPAKFYDEFLEAMSVTHREIYKTEFPLGKKVVVRR
jgi:hypothetical protein